VLLQEQQETQRKTLNKLLPVPLLKAWDPNLMSTRKSGMVAILGRPNVGKSTLLNALLGEKISIVSAKAQTTRDRVLGIFTDPVGQLVFIDTPGIHRARDGGINAHMMEEVRAALEGVEVIWYLVDPQSEEKYEELVLETLSLAKDTPLILMLTKADLARGTRARGWHENFRKRLALKIVDRGFRLLGDLSVSSTKKKGLDELLALTWPVIPVGDFLFPDEEQLSDRDLRFLAAERIREQLFLQLGEEVPYACGIEIKKFEEPGPRHPKLKQPRIEATIFVERESQKPMVIGAGGSKIKAIGIAARSEIEKLMGTSVFLGLKVETLKNWTKDPELMKRLGYQGRRKGA
jgi:GTP-binding protein Era